jgi:hypothetical protein
MGQAGPPSYDVLAPTACDRMGADGVLLGAQRPWTL